MSLYLPPEQKEKALGDFQRTVGTNYVNRREFMKGLAGASLALPISAAAYFGYQKLKGNPVKAGLIGAGNEGGVLVGEHNPEYLEFIAYSDIRPYNQKRIFEGEDPKRSPRKGFNRIYGKDANKKIKLYEDYKQLLQNPDIEAVVIALPLHIHAQVAIEAMKAGKHVLCEKLMAWNVNQCKEMIRVSDETNKILTIGHQRHYSMLYAHAVEVINSGELGDIKHIRALWHRNNSWPRLDAKNNPIKEPNGAIMLRDGWREAIPEEDREKLAADIKKHGYKSMEELVRWRLFNRTGGGLMAELGSHQLDASSIFLGKVHPLAVTGVGGKFFYHDEREVDDSVFVTFEFPGKNYYADKEHKNIKDKNDVVVVTYSSINTNGFEPYGESVMGSRATLMVLEEKEAMLLRERNPNEAAKKPIDSSVTTAGGPKKALESSASTGGPDPVKAGADALSGPVSKGYREEMEHFAYCVRLHQQAGSTEDMTKIRLTPRCHGRVAMADAIIALTSNLAMNRRQRIEFKREWFEAASEAVPDPEMKPEAV
jgi:predicted dehydrogenase